ncbi:organic cation/carnitine transporter 7-like [Melia azedarach]|uniref:Organic cation/carnitine transporter 7-like n=1 Tax=Melia azedarach TaxID=155640 RepID=A0ACC1XD61_MELAZ|nr:organic cation/carnitine transporter 7-like [Melia azedarach]
MDAEMPVYTLDDALNTLGFGKFQGFLLVFAGLGLVAEAMEIMILSFIGPATKSEWDLSPNQETLLTSVVFAGLLVGSYAWGVISDNYGRRKGFLGIAMVASVAGLLSAFSPNYLSLVTLRCLAGIGLGSGPVFLSWFLEFIPASNRGTWVVVISIFWTIGTIFEAALALIVMPGLNWRWLLALSSVPSFAVLLLLGLAPESARYLCSAGRTVDAHHILEKIAQWNHTDLPDGMLVSDKTATPDEEFAIPEHTPPLSSTTEVKPGSSSCFMLLSSKLIRTTLLLWVLFFGNSFLYYGIILLTSELSSEQTKCSSTLLLLQNAQDGSLYINVFITSLAELPGLLLSAVIVDRIGRKMSMAITSILTFICLLPLVIPQPAAITTALLFGARMFINGTYTVASIYAPEVYPTSLRATGSGIACAVGRIGGMICPIVAVGLLSSCNQTAAIVLLEIVTVVSVVSIQLFPFETKGRELTDTVTCTTTLVSNPR